MIAVLEITIPLCNIVGIACFVSGYLMAGQDVDEAMYNYEEALENGKVDVCDVAVYAWFMSSLFSVVYIAWRFLGY